MQSEGGGRSAAWKAARMARSARARLACPVARPTASHSALSSARRASWPAVSRSTSTDCRSGLIADLEDRSGGVLALAHHPVGAGLQPDGRVLLVLEWGG